VTITQDQLPTLAAATGDVLDPSGDKVGRIGQIYLDDETGEPTWVTAKTGLFGTSESFVPLRGASAQGEDIRVGYDTATVKDAPRVDADQTLSPEEEDKLYAYYGLSGTRDAGGAGYDVENVDRATDGNADATDSPGTVGRDTSGPTTDEAMTRSEERLNVGTQTREAGRARLRKYVVTENVTQTVPVRHEEVRVEREPITDANIGAATSGPAISEEEHEVILHEERPVVEKTAVPVERVRLGTETVSEQATVSEDVRKEQIETETDGVRDR